MNLGALLNSPAVRWVRQHLVTVGCSIGLSAVFCSTVGGAAPPAVAGVTVRLLANDAAPGRMTRLARDPGSPVLYNLTESGNIYRIDLRAASPTPILSTTPAQHGVTGGAGYGLAFGPDRTLYVLGNANSGSDHTTCTVAKGMLDANQVRT